MNDLLDIVGPVFLGVIIFLVLFLVLGFPLCGWIQSDLQSKMWNKKYGTNYTAKDFFFCGETIKNYFSNGENKTFNIKPIKED